MAGTREHHTATATPDQAPMPLEDQDVAAAPKTQFSSKGPLPAVDTAQHTAGPSASDRGFGAAETGGSSHALSGPARLRVTADGLNVRATPTSAARDNIIGGVHHGEHLEADGHREGEWLCVTFQGQRAFVHGRYVEVEPAKVDPAIAAQPEKAVEAAKEVEKAPAVAAAAPTHVDAPAPAAPAPVHVDAPAAAAAPAPVHAAAAAPAHAAAGPAHAAAVPAHAAAVPAHAAAAPAHAAAAPAHVATAPAPHAVHSDPAVVRAEYQMLIAAARSGLLSPGTAVEMFIKFDREHNGGQVSVTGIELVGTMPFDIAKAHVAEANEKVPVKPGPDPTHDAAAAHHDVAAKDVATKHEPAPTVAPAPAEASKGTDSKTSSGGPAGVWTPPADAHMTDASLAQLGAQLHDGNADQVLTDLAGVMTIAAGMKPHLYNHVEANGPQRENLVAGIHAVRTRLQAIAGGDAKVEAFKVAVNHKLEALSPYYAQINIMTIESGGGLSTCNMTSLAMSLSTIGKNADSYKEAKRPTIVAVAKYFHKDVASAARANTGHEAAFSSLRGLRLPDFMELAAIANRLHSATPSDGEIKAAADYAVSNKTDISYLAEIAADFGANTSLSYHTIGNKTAGLKKVGKAHHFETDQLVDLRNKAEANPDDKAARADYEKAKAAIDPHINSAEVEKDMPLQDYKSSVMATIKPLLDSGAGVVAGTYMHFTHCYEMTDDHIKVQDPGQWKRADRMIHWDEARALEYFWNYLVVR